MNNIKIKRDLFGLNNIGGGLQKNPSNEASVYIRKRS